MARRATQRRWPERGVGYSLQPAESDLAVPAGAARRHGAWQSHGTNQRGKYAEHHHHVQSAADSADVGNVYIGHPRGKWGLVVHVTSDTLVEQNIAVDFPGAAFVTEDGYEVRNVFRQNFAAYSLGATRDAQAHLSDASDNVTRGCPGCEGTVSGCEAS